MEFKCYIIFSESRDKFYVGITGGDLKERIRKHNTDHKGFTGHIGDWSLVYWETFDDKKDALRREKEIKRWKSRKRIIELIKIY
jgi:putative endonuclease